MDANGWHRALRRYAIASAALHLLWELAQLPLYTIWQQGSIREIAIAVAHCTAGDVVIAMVTLFAALIVAGNARWPFEKRLPTAALAIAAGIVYTVFSERTNVARGSWTYAELMPMVPWIHVGLTPLLQWLVVPGIVFRWSTSAGRHAP